VEGRVLFEKEGRNAMARETILYISDKAAASDSILAALKTTGYEVVSTDISTQAIALLFIMHSVTGIVLRDRAGEHTSFDVARSLRALRPDVPIVLLCEDRIDRLPTYVDACVNTGQPIERLTSEVQHWLTAERFPVVHRGQLRPQDGDEEQDIDRVADLAVSISGLPSATRAFTRIRDKNK